MKIIFESDLPFQDKVEKGCDLIRHEVAKSINKNIKDFYYPLTVWSKFTFTKTKESKTYKESKYYFKNHSNFDKKDWRFCEVKGKRSLAVFEGLVLVDCSLIKKQNHSKDYHEYLNQFL